MLFTNSINDKNQRKKNLLLCWWRRN